MADYGVTDAGFLIKRYEDIVLEQQQEAQEAFQDLVEPGDTVDVSSSSVLGRLITIDAAGDSTLWEVLQLIYNAFDPNSATGVALDNLVALGGIVRQSDTYSTGQVLLSGDTGTTIPAGSEVSASGTNNSFTTTQLVQLNATAASGVTLVVQSVQNTTLYTITYATNSATQNVNYTSSGSATASEILNGLQAVIASSHPSLTASVVGSTLVIDRTDVFSTVNFSVTSNLAINKARKVVDIISEEVGEIEQAASTIDTIVTPVLGWDSVTNPSAITSGRLEETDEELRIRFRNSKFERASNIIESLYSALFAVDTVSEVVIYENDTDVTDTNGIPPHSFSPVVVGGTSTDIANAIWQNKPVGILSYGNTTVSITDSQGFVHDVSFERPNPVVIYIDMALTTDSDFPSDGADLIRSAIVEYFEENLGVGDDVIYSRLFTPINSVAGHQVDSLYIGLSASPTGTASLPIAFNEIASINDVNITIST